MKTLLLISILALSAFPLFAQTNIITAVAGNGSSGYSGDGGTATNASLNNPTDMAVDSHGNLFIADYNNQRIRRVDANGVITTVAGNGSTGYSGDGGAATNASLNYPEGVALDANGNLFIADGDNSRVRKVGTDGIITTVAGNGSAGYSGDGGAATGAELNHPCGVALDAHGNLFITDQAEQRIREVGTNGIITTVAGNGSAGYSGDGGAAINASLNNPIGVAVDSLGNLFIAGYQDQRIRKVGTNGVITTVAGNGSAGYSGDGGAATNAGLNYPTRVAVDSQGNLFIADYHNERIRKVDTTGIITTVAGNGSTGYSGDGGAATNASLYYPEGVALDVNSNMFIVDRYNERIRKVNFVTVSNPLILQFTATPTSGTVPLSVQFNSPSVDSGGNTILSWNWNFGDGSTSTLQNPSHIYTNAGTFLPNLVATNNNGIMIQGTGPSIEINLLAASPGTVVAWGENNYGQTTVPAGLSGVIAIAAGYAHTVALKSDGTVVAWGDNANGQTTVPAGLNNVTAIAAGEGDTVALKNDGTVVAWGWNDFGGTTVPAGLNNVTAIAAGYGHTVALKNDGTVVAWGDNGNGQTSVPAGLNDVTAIAAGYYHTVALKSDGTVVAWGDNGNGQTSVPAGLNDVTAIAAGNAHTLALKSDGTVVAWGDNGNGQTTVPAGLNDVTAIAAGYAHTVALKSDGTVVAWGFNDFGQTTVPVGLNSVTAIAAGYGQTVAIGISPPSIATQPQPSSANVVAGTSLQYSAQAVGSIPLAYQWNFNGSPIVGAAASTLQLNKVTTNQTGDYTVVVTNLFGSITSSPAVLTVFNPATIVSQTTNIPTAYGFTETMSVVATGTAIQYQWFFGSMPIAGATNASLTLTNIGNANAGTYYVVVSNAVSSIKSQPIQVSAYTAVRILPTGSWPGVNPPIGYWPSVPMTYTIKAGPPSGTIDYALQEQITSGNGADVNIGPISDGGVFNAGTSTINWGPFFDNSTRTLTYVITPLPGMTNWIQFNGVISINGTNATIVGGSEINLLPLDPADNGGEDAQPVDNFIGINEVTAYGNAWKYDTFWPVVPNPIPISYVTSAGVIWKQGEYYIYNPSLGAPPACWVNATPPPGIVAAAIASRLSSSVKSRGEGPIPLDDSTSTAICSMPGIYTNNVPVTVTLTVTPASSVGVYAVEDKIPLGWAATNFSTGGAFDSINNEVKYGPFFDNSARTLTYQVTPPSNFTGAAIFSGTASYDGLGMPITGVRQLISNATPPVFQQAILSPKGFVLTWSSVPTLAYQLQYTSNLVSGIWINVGGVLSGTNSIMTATNSIGSNSQGFYRVQLVQ